MKKKIRINFGLHSLTIIPITPRLKWIRRTDSKTAFSVATNFLLFIYLKKYECAGKEYSFRLVRPKTA